MSKSTTQPAAEWSQNMSQPITKSFTNSTASPIGYIIFDGHLEAQWQWGIWLSAIYKRNRFS